MKKIVANEHKIIKFNSLSKAVEQVHPDEEKLSLVQKAIQTIDNVPAKYLNVKILYLSGNFIEDLSGIEQFKMVKVLSVASNTICKIHSLEHLYKMKHLQNLSLSGNPVTKHLLFKTFVIPGCRSLRTLDKISITESDRVYLTRIKQQVDNNFGQLLQNYLQMMKICMFSRKMQCHKQLSTRTYTINIYKTFMKVCALEQDISSKYRLSLWESLYADCFEIFVNRSRKQGLRDEELFILATEDMNLRQKLKIADLELKLEAKIQRMFPAKSSLGQSQLFQSRQSEGQELADQYYQKKKLLNIFIKWRRLPKKIKNKIVISRGISTIFQGLSKFTTNLKQEVFHIMVDINQNENIKIERIMQLMRKRQLLKAWKQFIVYVKQKQEITQKQKTESIKQKRLRKIDLKKYMSIWKDQFSKKQIEKNSQEIYLKFQEYKEKENKYKKKIELLEQLLQINKKEWQRQKCELIRKSKVEELCSIEYAFQSSEKKLAESNSRAYLTKRSQDEDMRPISMVYKENNQNGINKQRILNKRQVFEFEGRK